MKTIEQLRQQVENYEEMLLVMRRRFAGLQDEVAERLVSRMLFDAANKLKALEQNAVKIHRTFEPASNGPFLSKTSESRISGGPRAPRRPS